MQMLEHTLGLSTSLTTFKFREKVVETHLMTSPLFTYNENLSFQSGRSPLRGLKVESLHFEMTHPEPRSTLAVRASRERNDYFSAKQLRFFSRQMESEQPSRLVIGRTGVSDHEIQTNARIEVVRSQGTYGMSALHF